MNSLLMLIPLIPLCSAGILLLLKPKAFWVRVLGVGSVSLAALLVIALNIQLWHQELFIIKSSFGHWLSLSQPNANSLNVQFGLYLDPLSLVMITIICCIGSLIHIYSASYMVNDPHQCRFFAYLNLFVSAMLILVLADNLLLLYLGWEGVGLCSYLLIGFWYQKTANNHAANKAFIITRIGDTGMLIGIIMLFYQFDSLNIQQIQYQAQQLGLGDTRLLDPMIAISCLLLFAGAAGKSAQMPLHSWLPDAMAGPTPVSALIHAATMVTAGVYLVARNDALFQLSPHVLQFIAITGVLTLLLGATSALFQTDLKRILAYSTISQLGYMFLALGVGAASSAVFHLMTHAFFKALLFLSAGALIYCMHHEQNIMKMGGLYKKLPLLTVSFAVGCAALASLPLTSGFFSKELILEKVALAGEPWLWWGAVIGALLTAMYSAKLFFMIFFGKLQSAPTAQTPKTMAAVLIVLTCLALMGGLQPQGIELMFTATTESGNSSLSSLQHWLPILLPIGAIALTGFLCIKTNIFQISTYQQPDTDGLAKVNPPSRLSLIQTLRDGWGFDVLYQKILIKPFYRLTYINRHDLINRGFISIEKISSYLHLMFNRMQTGHLRSYSASLILFFVFAIAWGAIR